MAEKDDDDSGKSPLEGIKDVVSSIDTPLKFMALVTVFFYLLLAIFAHSVDSGYSGLLFIVGFVGFLLFLLGCFIYLAKSKSFRVPKIGEVENKKRDFKYDFFVAAPMAAIKTDAQYIEHRAHVMEIIKTIQHSLKLKKYFYAGKDIHKLEEFETVDISAKHDMEAIKNSRYFILLSFQKLEKPSSVIYEAGFALALGKQSLYFGIDENFPFLMKKVDSAFKHVSIHTASSANEVMKIIKNNGVNLLELD
jgi:hypothetical protein